MSGKGKRKKRKKVEIVLWLPVGPGSLSQTTLKVYNIIVIQIDKDIYRMFSLWLQFQTKPPPKS